MNADLYPRRPSLARRLTAPPLSALAFYALIRVTNDGSWSKTVINFDRPLAIFAVEIAGTIALFYLLFEALFALRRKIFLRWSDALLPSAYLLKESKVVFAASLLLINSFGLTFTALTDDGLSFYDAFAINLLGIMFTAAHLGFTRGRDYIRLFNQAEIERERYKQESATARYQALQHQLNPHFLFNSLNTLSSLVHRDAEAADEFIRELAKVYRYVLDAGEHDSVKLGEELKFLDSYLYLLKTRFKEALCVSVATREEHLELRLPPLTLQVLLENAVKHNIVSAKQPLVCSISSNDDNSLSVRNTLQERSEKDGSSSIGLANLQARYEYLHGGDNPAKPLVFVGEREFTVIVPLLHGNQ